MSQAERERVITKAITVERAVSDAFRVWTEQIHTWWPRSHSLSGDPGTRVMIEGRTGGRFYKRTSNGDEHVWGEVVAWDPPHFFAHTWVMGSGPALPSPVEVSFVPLDDGATRVEIAHRGPEFIGDLWWTVKSRFDVGWSAVLPGFAGACDGLT